MLVIRRLTLEGSIDLDSNTLKKFLCWVSVVNNYVQKANSFRVFIQKTWQNKQKPRLD